MANGIIRGALFKREARAGEDQSKQHPVYDIQLEVLGVKLRLAAWPQVAAKNGTVKYMPISGDYAQNETRRLVDVTPVMAIAKSQKELLREGRRMGNCVGMGTYGRGIIEGDRLIVIIQGKGAKQRFDVEIDRKRWQVRQCYGPHNSDVPDAVRQLATLIATTLKEADARNNRKKRTGRAA